VNRKKHLLDVHFANRCNSELPARPVRCGPDHSAGHDNRGSSDPHQLDGVRNRGGDHGQVPLLAQSSREAKGGGPRIQDDPAAILDEVSRPSSDCDLLGGVLTEAEIRVRLIQWADGDRSASRPSHRAAQGELEQISPDRLVRDAKDVDQLTAPYAAALPND
jgi:hypothetical protein